MHLSKATCIAVISSGTLWKSNPRLWRYYLGVFYPATHHLRTISLVLLRLSGCQLRFWHFTFANQTLQCVCWSFSLLWNIIRAHRTHLNIISVITSKTENISVPSPSCAGRGVASVEGSSELAGLEDRVWLLLLLVSLQKTADWLLLELGAGSGVQSSSGCFFCMSDGKNRECEHP